MIDIVFLTHNRLEYTQASLQALIDNTDWHLVDRLMIFDDASTDGTREYVTSLKYPIPAELDFGKWGNPVAVMREYLDVSYAQMFAKIDNDTMVPKHWLAQCLNVMEAHAELDLLGIEVFRDVIAGEVKRSYDRASFIGGIGLMRTRAFSERQSLPQPNGRRFGFTEWQQLRVAQNKLVPGWLNPALPVFLLDHLPREPWCSLYQKYVEQGEDVQRPWNSFYNEASKSMWEWFCE